MNRIFSLAAITYKEGIRSRSVFGILLFSLFILGLNIAVAGFFMRDIGKVTVDMNLSALSFSGLLLVLFVGLNLMAKDIDKKTIHLVLSKPISREGYIWGKFFGITLFVFVSLLVLFVFSCATVFLLFHMYPDYFEGFVWGTFFISCFFIFIKLSVLSAIVIFFSSITTSSFITLVFSICAYIVGATIEEVIFYLKSGFREESISPALQRFIEIIAYIFPNFSVFDFKTEAAHGLPVAFDRLGLSLGYAVIYIVLVLLLASVIFRRREFN